MKKLFLFAVLIGLLARDMGFSQQLSFYRFIAGGLGWYYEDGESKLLAVDNYQWYSRRRCKGLDSTLGRMFLWKNSAMSPADNAGIRAPGNGGRDV
jgi:hypothetical protein